MPINALRAIGEVIGVLVASMLGLVIAASFLGTRYASPLGMLFGVAVAVMFIKLRGESLADFGFRPAKLLRSIFSIGVILAFSLVLFLYAEPVLERYFGPVDLSFFAPLAGNISAYFVLLIAAWIGAAFGEEVVYRGFIMTRLAQIFSFSSFGWILAILLQASLFGFAHSYQGMVGMIEIFLLAIVMGAGYVFCGRSLWPLIIAHGLIDTFVLTDFYLDSALTDAIIAAG